MEPSQEIIDRFLSKIIQPTLVKMVRESEEDLDDTEDLNNDLYGGAWEDPEEETAEQKEERIQQEVRQLLEEPWAREFMSNTLKALRKNPKRGSEAAKFIHAHFMSKFHPKWMEVMTKQKDKLEQEIALANTECAEMKQESADMEDELNRLGQMILDQQETIFTLIFTEHVCQHD